MSKVILNKQNNPKCEQRTRGLTLLKGQILFADTGTLKECSWTELSPDVNGTNLANILLKLRLFKDISVMCVDCAAWGIDRCERTQENWK